MLSQRASHVAAQRAIARARFGGQIKGRHASTVGDRLASVVPLGTTRQEVIDRWWFILESGGDREPASRAGGI